MGALHTLRHYCAMLIIIRILGGLANRVALLGQRGSCIRVGRRRLFVGQNHFIENKVERYAEQQVGQGNAHDNRPSGNRQWTCLEDFLVCVFVKYLVTKKLIAVIMTYDSSGE